MKWKPWNLCNAPSRTRSHSPPTPGYPEVATYTGLSVHTLYTMVSQRRIPFVKMGRLTKFDRVELDKWIAGHRKSAPVTRHHCPLDGW